MDDTAFTLYGPNGRPLSVSDYVEAQNPGVSWSNIAKRDRSLVAFISPWQAQSGIAAPSSFHIKDLLGVYGDGEIRNPHVYAAVRAKADLASQIPLQLHLYEGRKKGDAIEEHPALDLLDKVNPQMTYMDFIEAGTSYLELAGTLFVGIEHPSDPENPLAIPEELWPLRPDRMTIVPSLRPETFGDILRYVLKTGTNENFWSRYDPEEMLVVKYFSPMTPYWGLPPLTAARLTLLHDHFQQDFMSKFFQQGLHVGGLLTVDGLLNEEMFQRMRSQWMEENTGRQNMHKPLVLEGGVKWQQTTAAPKDVEFAEGRLMNKHELVGEIFGMSPKAVGDYSDASVLQNADAMDRSDWTAALRVVQKIANTLNEFLLPRYEDARPLRFFPDTSNIPALREDEEKKARVYLTLREAGWPHERALARVYPDEEPFEDEFEGTETEELELRLEKGCGPGGKKRRRRKKTALESIKKGFIEDVARLENAFMDAMEPGFEQWGSNVFKAALPELESVLKQIGEKRITTRKAVSLVVKSVDFAQFGDTLFDALQPVYRTVAQKAIGFANGTLELSGIAPVSFQLINEQVSSFLRDEGLILVKSVTKTTKDAIRKTLIEGMEQGEGIPKLTSRLQDIVDGYAGKGQRYRAERVARTEAISAMNKSAELTYRQAGVKLKKWLDTGDSRQDDLCFQLAALDPVPISASFMDGIRRPPAHVNCLPGDSLVSSRARISAVSKRWYDGDLLTIRTAKGDIFSCTPNHPIATPQGWIGASNLNTFSHIVYDLSRERVGACNDQYYQRPTPIQDIAEAFIRDSSVFPIEVPVAAPDFHNDGEGSEVATIWSHGMLRDKIDVSLLQSLMQLSLVQRRLLSVYLARKCTENLGFQRTGTSKRGFMGSRDLPPSLFLSHLLPFYLLSLALSSQGDSRFNQTRGDSFSATAVPFGQSINGQASEVGLDQVLGVDVQSFHGYVYNLQTDSGSYLHNGTILSNCRCALTPVVEL